MRTTAILRRYVKTASLLALLCALTLVLAGFGGSPQQPLPPLEPETVGQVTGLRASTEGQGPGTVKLTWNAAENAQVYFVVYLKTDDARAKDYGSTKMATFTTTEGAISGLESGTSYHFVVAGMRWNWAKYGAVWGKWSSWVSMTPAIASAATDKAALVALYHATDGPNWTNNSNWLSDAPIGQWHGVTTDDSGMVVGLHIGGNQLTGELPADLGNLTNLTRLDIAVNQLNGPLPAELGNLVNLKSLRFQINQFSGEIPAELGNLAELTQIIGHTNRLSGRIPSELGDLANLQNLRLDENRLSGGIPTEFGSLTNLRGLELFDNRLSGTIPTELGNLSNLTVLSLNRNQLSGSIPTELGNLSNLTRMDLSNNRLTGAIPAELGTLTSLNLLRLGNNLLTGCVPAALRDVRSNDFAGLGLPFCG